MSPEKNINEVLNEINSADFSTRITAIDRLVNYAGEDIETVLQALINLLSDPDDTIKIAALKALGELLPHYKRYSVDAAREMVRLLVRPVGTIVKTAVISILYQIPVPKMKLLMPLMGDENTEVVQGANKAYLDLFKNKGGTESIIPTPTPREIIPFDQLDMQSLMETLTRLQTVDATEEYKAVKVEDEAPREPLIERELEEKAGAMPEEDAFEFEELPASDLERPRSEAPPPPSAAAPAPQVLKPAPKRRALPAVELPAASMPPAAPDMPDEQKSINEETQFSAYYPREIEPNKWKPMTAYVYKATAADKIILDAQQQLGGLIATMRRIIKPARQNIPQGTLITATPYLKGFQFNPPQAVVGFYEDWHRFDFKMRAVDAPLNLSANGYLTFTIDGIIMADIPLSVYVGDAVDASSMVTMSQKIYKSIFCSYSRDDTAIIERVERVYKTLGFDFLRDIHTIKSGQDWSDELYEMIDEADIFQLFWSSTAATSGWVEKEWRYALSLDRDEINFIRPVYWEEPIPPVPDELDHIHFAFEPTLDDY